MLHTFFLNVVDEDRLTRALDFCEDPLDVENHPDSGGWCDREAVGHRGREQGGLEIWETLMRQALSLLVYSAGHRNRGARLQCLVRLSSHSRFILEQLNARR